MYTFLTKHVYLVSKKKGINMFKKILPIIICTSMAFSNPAFSSSFGKSSSGSSSGSRSTSSSQSSRPSSPSHSPSASPSHSSGSLSGGQSVGMTRSAVTDSVRNNTYKQPPATPSVSPSQSANNSNAPNTGYNGGYQNNPSNQGNNYQTQPRSYGMGTVLGAAAAAGLVGYMLHKDSSGNSYYTNPSNPNVAYDSNGSRMPSIPQGNFANQGTIDSNGSLNPSAAGSMNNNYGVNGAPAKSGLGWMTWLLIIAGLLGAGVYFLRNRRT